MYRVTNDYLSMMAMSALSESLFSRVKNIVTDNRNRFNATTIRILTITMVRGSLRKELSITADLIQDVQVNREANQDVLVADDTSAVDDATRARPQPTKWTQYKSHTRSTVKSVAYSEKANINTRGVP